MAVRDGIDAHFVWDGSGLCVQQKQQRKQMHPFR